MKCLIFPIPFLLLALCSFSQKLSHITFTGGTTFSSFSFLTDQQVIIKISDDGKVLEWGTDPGPGRYYYYPGKLQPYMGRVEYYGPELDSVLRGKVKSIGTCVLTYYSSYETESKTGKIKSIGSVALDYYTNYETQAPKGKLKSAGYILLSYYSSFENEAYRDKLKSVDNNLITYYSTFDDQVIKGKIKTIGAFTYTWYSSHDRKEFWGALKSGAITQNAGGVTYIVR
jgi:hypothetical protein